MSMPSLLEALEKDQKFALVVQGGGMRGTYSIAALAELEKHGLNDRFGDIFATSAGALNATYYLAGQAQVGISAYLDHLSNKRFINKKRLRRVIDIDYLIDHVLAYQVPLDIDAVYASSTHLHIGMTSTHTGQIVWGDNRGSWPLFELLRATAAMPILFGKEIKIGSHGFVDGGMISTVPLFRAIELGYENILVILTRPLSHPLDAPHPLASKMVQMVARQRGHSPAVVKQLGREDAGLADVFAAVRLNASGQGKQQVWVISPSRAIASRLTHNRLALKDTAELAAADTLDILNGDKDSMLIQNHII